MNIYSCILCMYTFISLFIFYGKSHPQGTTRIPTSSWVYLSMREDHYSSTPDNPRICFSSFDISSFGSDYG